MNVHAAQSDITTFEVDAIVVPCSASAINSGFLALITDKGADELSAQLKAKAPLAIGAAIIADCPKLEAKNAILVPIIKHPEDDVATELLRRAVKAALIASKIKGYQSIALPRMVCDEGGATVAEATRAVVQELRTHDDPLPETIYLVDPEEATVQIFENAIKYSQHSL